MKVKLTLFTSLFVTMMLIQSVKTHAQSLEAKVKDLTHEILTSLNDENTSEASIQKKQEKLTPEQENVRESIITNLKAAPCPAGYYCLHGFCISYWEGIPCQTNEECPDVQVCYDGRCRVFGGGPCD